MIKTQQSFSAAVEKPVAPVRCIVQNLYFNFKTFASVRHVCVKEHSLTFQYFICVCGFNFSGATVVVFEDFM